MAHSGTLMGCALPTESWNAAATHMGNSGTVCYEPLSSPWICSSFWVWIQSPSIPGNERRAIPSHARWHQPWDGGVILLLESSWGFKVVELLVFFCVTGITTQNNSHPLSILFWGLIIDCLGSDLLHSASISLSVKWGNNNTSLIRCLCRLNELIFIKELEQYSV